MRVKLNWLNELVDLSDLATKEIVDTLALHSTEIESIEHVVSGTNLVVGHVLTCVDHPDSDHLHITTVDVGSEVLQIVCGAPNIKAGLYVIVALVGAELPGGIKIKKAKVRGVESSGMICSLAELGMEKKYIDEEHLGMYSMHLAFRIPKNDMDLKRFMYSLEMSEISYPRIVYIRLAELLNQLHISNEVMQWYEHKIEVSGR